MSESIFATIVFLSVYLIAVIFNLTVITVYNWKYVHTLRDILCPDDIEYSMCDTPEITFFPVIWMPVFNVIATLGIIIVLIGLSIKYLVSFTDIPKWINSVLDFQFK